jgi:uncharacterized protein YndB with AHSA1/START domain
VKVVAGETTKIHIVRVFDAPRELVFKAFTDPDLLAQWFGPVGFSVPRDELIIEATAGGVERIVMVNDATNERIELVGHYTEVIPLELIAGADAEPDSGNFRFEFFDEPNGRTRLELTAWSVTPEWSDGAPEGWESSFTKLDELVRSKREGATAPSSHRPDEVPPKEFAN